MKILKVDGTKILRLQTLITLAQLAAVQNTWYTICNLTGDLEIDWGNIQMDTLAEDIELSITIDGIDPTDGAQAAAVANTPYYARLYPSTTAILTSLASGLANTLLSFTTTVKCRAFKLEVRKTSANGANTLRGACMYHRR